ncbi:outer membrane protein transport protein [Deltaproteobacteria bacterium TL4]
MLVGTNHLIMGNANATMPTDASTTVNNPAGLMRLQPGLHVHIGAAFVEFKLSWEGAFGGFGDPKDDWKAEGPVHTVDVKPIEINGQPMPIVGPAPMFQAAQVFNDWAYGFAMKPFVAAPVSWPKDWVGKNLVQNMEMAIAGGNGVIAKKLNDNHSVAFGMSLQFMVMKFRRNGITLNGHNPHLKTAVNDYMDYLVEDKYPIAKTGDIYKSFVEPNIVDPLMDFLLPVILDKPIQANGKIELFGTGVSYNWNLSYMGNHENIFWAINYNSEINYDLEIQGEFDINPLLSVLLKTVDNYSAKLKVPGTQISVMPGGLGMAIEDQTVDTSITLPWVFEAAIGWKNDELHPKLEMELGYARMAYSSVEKLDARLRDPSNILPAVGLQSDRIVVDLRLQDVDTYRAGAAFHLNERYILRGGVEISSSLSDPRYVGAVIPVSSIKSFGGGGEYVYDENNRFAAGFSYWLFDKTETPTDAADNVVFTGVLEDRFPGTYTGHVMLVSFSFSHRFGPGDDG